MKILLVSDEESPSLWEHYSPQKVQGVDMILSAGDLKASYLSFLVTMVNRPLLYVHGNHDGRYAAAPPEGCQCIEDQLVKINGLRILGLGGCRRYSQGPHQYTEREMQRRIWRLQLKLLRAGGVDLVLTHAPVQGHGDLDDIAHKGFSCFLTLLEKYQPQYWIHGHVHKRYGAEIQRCLSCGSTTIVNASGHYILDI